MIGIYRLCQVIQLSKICLLNTLFSSLGEYFCLKVVPAQMSPFDVVFDGLVQSYFLKFSQG